MKLLDKSVNNLAQRLDKLYPDTSSSNSNSDGINYWKGRKIIPLDKWLKITKANTISRKENYNVREGLQYFPDDYIKWMFPLGIPEDLKEDANKWYSDYIELMELRRNSHYGKTKCFGCLLSPDAEDSALFIGINKVIDRALEDRNSYNISKEDTSNSCNNNDPRSSTTSTGTSLYPCKVLNRYTCPYDNKSTIKADATFDIDDLFTLYKLAFQVELAFAHAYSITKSNETIYEADFEAGKVKETTSLYNGSPHSWSTDYPLDEKLSQVQKLSKVSIRNVKDVYSALTDREILDNVLEQGLDDEEYQRHRDQIVNLFMDIKDKIKVEDLNLYEPIFTSNIQKRKCTICQGFANIHCISCSNNNVWLCVDHWVQHKADCNTKG